MVSQEVWCLEQKRKKLLRVFGSECASNKAIHKDVASVDKRLRVHEV